MRMTTLGHRCANVKWEMLMLPLTTGKAAQAATGFNVMGYSCSGFLAMLWS